MTWRRGLAVLFCLGAVAWAGDEDLEKRVGDLEQRLDAVEDTDTRTAEEKREDAVEELAAGLLDDDAGLGLNMVIRKGNVQGIVQLFGDVGFNYTNPEIPNRSNSFFFSGSFDFFFTARAGDHFRALTEINFQPKIEEPNDDSHFDLERIWGGWEFSDAVFLKFGLEHGPISLWNRLFHHGRWLELAINRPFLAAFEGGGGIIPMHEAGIEVMGRLQAGKGQFAYSVFLSNGRGQSPNVVQEFSDKNDDKAVTFGGGYHFDAPQTIFIGIFLRRDEIPPNASNPGQPDPLRDWVATFQFMFSGEKITILSEFAYINQDDQVANQNYDGYSAYFQFGYHVDDQWTPYLRFDVRQMDEGWPYYMPLNRDLDIWELLFGLRWDFIDNAALKFEVGFGDRQNRDESTGVVSTGNYVRIGTQLAFVF